MTVFKRHARLWTVLFFLALTLIGLVTAGDYGMYCDEFSEQEILRQNLYEYAVQLLGNDSAPAQYYEAQGVELISQSIERDHGEAAYYPAAPLLLLAKQSADVLSTLWHAYTWLWFMAAVVALYLLAESLGLSRILRIATALLLYLSPRFFAQGHYNNKDIVLLALVLCTLASGARFLKAPTLRRALLFSLFGALATNTKIIGILPWGLIGIATFVTLFHRRALTTGRVLSGITAIIAFVCFYWLLTPAAWDDPAGYITYLLGNASGFSRWHGVILFNGVHYNPTRGLPLPRLYLPTMITLTTPLWLLALAALGQLAAILLCIKRDNRSPLLIVLTLLWLLPVGYVVIARPLLYNGWRHFYFIYAAIAAMGGLALQMLATALVEQKIRRAIGVGALIAAMGWQAVGLIQNHPYQYAYYNVLVSSAQGQYELDYWDVSTVNAMKKLCASTERNTALPLELGTRDDMSAFGVENGYVILPDKERTLLTVTDDPDAPYLFYNETYASIYGVEPPQGYTALFSLESYGNVICTVYEQMAAGN